MNGSESIATAAAADATSTGADDLVYFNGIDAETGVSPFC
jgi:hypothetical protein